VLCLLMIVIGSSLQIQKTNKTTRIKPRMTFVSDDNSLESLDRE